MRHFSLTNFDPKITLLGGQAFNWDQHGSRYQGFTQHEVIRARFGTHSTFRVYSGQSTPVSSSKFSANTYFQTTVSYKQIVSSFNKDQHTATAIKKYYGLRVLRQPFEQTLLSYILSAQNNIKRIRLIVRNLAGMLGEPVLAGQNSVYLFPSTEVLANAPISTLIKAGCGFRAKYLKSSAQKLLDTKLSSKIGKFSEKRAREALLSFPGVGPKIADCVLLYALGFNDVLPLDVWCTRVLTDLYGLNPKMKYEYMQTWGKEYFGPYAGWAGQFLFEYLRNRKPSPVLTAR